MIEYIHCQDKMWYKGDSNFLKGKMSAFLANVSLNM